MPDLQAVDHDPFAPPVTVPVDHDPFSPQAAFEAAAARVRAPYVKANARVSGLPDVGTVLGNKLVNTLMAGPNLMGQVAEGSIDPNSPEAIRRSTDVAASTLGYGMMGARPGAAGMAGGRLTQPAPVAEAAAKTGGMGDFIQAYHGSPHDFDRFDLSKIGTGEGAQAYGHGLYFAENEGVANEYKNIVPKSGIRIGGKDMPAPSSGPERSAWVMLANDKGDVDRTMERAPAAVREVLQDWKSKGISFPKGNTYQVVIKAPPERFLDWDKPLSEQSPKVQEAIKKLPLSESDMKDILGDQGFSGMHLVQALNWHPSVAEGNAGRTTTALREAGIPGIKYLDQGSRGKGDGTRNYVVFDDKLIDIMKKYGIAGIGALPALNAYTHRTQSVDHDPFAE